MQISEVAKEFGWTTDTLRYYEREGLIGPISKGENGIRNKIDEIEEKIANKTASKKEIDTCGVLYLCLEPSPQQY